MRGRVGARDEHGPLTLEERAPLQAQGPLHRCVAQGRRTLKTPFTDLLLGKRRGSRRHRRRRQCLLLGRPHASRNERKGPRKNLNEEKRALQVAGIVYFARTRTRRALFGRHAAADGLRRIISSLAGCLRPPGANSISSFCSNDSLGRPHLHSPSLACRVFLIKKPYSSRTMATGFSHYCLRPSAAQLHDPPGQLRDCMGFC